MTIAEMKAKQDVPVVVVNQEGQIIYTNDEFGKVFGWNSEEAMGQPLSIIIPHNLQDAHNLGFSRFLATEEATLMGQALNLKAINRAGDEFDAEHYIIAEKIEEQWQFAATICPS